MDQNAQFSSILENFYPYDLSYNHDKHHKTFWWAEVLLRAYLKDR